MLNSAGGHVVLVAYRPKPGKDAKLLQIVRSHVPALRNLGLATERPAVVLRAKDGTLLEVFEWVSEEAVARAHSHPDVLRMWNEFAAACDIVKLTELPESNQMFPHFEPVEI